MAMLFYKGDISNLLWHLANVIFLRTNLYVNELSYMLMDGFFMKNDINRFVSHEYRTKEFEHMLQEISTKASISPELVRQYSTVAMKEWETQCGHDVLSLFTASPRNRHEEISKMIDHLRDHLRGIVFSKKKLDLISDIASKSLENMYNLF